MSKPIALLLALFSYSLMAQPAGQDDSLRLAQITDSADRELILELVTLSYQVPVDQMGEYSYFVFTLLGDTHSMNDDVAPDANGRIRHRVSVPRSLYVNLDLRVKPLSHFLYSYNRYDGRRFYTLSLENVPLRQLVGNLGLSLMHARRNQSSPSVDYLDDRYHGKSVTFHGERLTPVDVYDLVHEQTGCDIVESGGTLSVSCS